MYSSSSSSSSTVYYCVARNNPPCPVLPCPALLGAACLHSVSMNDLPDRNNPRGISEEVCRREHSNRPIRRPLKALRTPPTKIEDRRLDGSGDSFTESSYCTSTTANLVGDIPQDFLDWDRLDPASMPTRPQKQVL